MDLYFGSSAKKALALVSMVVCCGVAFLMWQRLALSGPPSLVPRPHTVAWDIVSLALQDQGIETVDGLHGMQDNLIYRGCRFLIERFGFTYRSMVAVQLPFLFLLLVGCGFVAWRFAGPYGGAVAPWVTLMGPTTAGLCNQLDGNLALLAFMAVTLALLVWADKPRVRLLAPLAVFPPILSGHTATYFSNGLMFLYVLTCAVAGLLVWQWWSWILRKRDNPDVSWASAPWLGTLCGPAAVGLGLYYFPQINFEYLRESFADTTFAPLSVWNSPVNFLAWPSVWWTIFAGPVMASIMLAGVLFALIRKKFPQLMFMLGWLALPMLGMVFLSKRKDIYALSAVPAMFILLTYGLSLIEGTKKRAIATVFCLALLAGSWFNMADNCKQTVHDQFTLSLFENISGMYLTKPRCSIPFDYKLGKWIAKKCSGRDLSVVFLNGTGISGLETFYTWYADPTIRIGDFRDGPSFGAPQCLVVNFDSQLKGPIEQPYTIHTAINMFKGIYFVEHHVDKPMLLERLDALEARAYDYVLLTTLRKWALFVPKSHATVAP